MVAASAKSLKSVLRETLPNPSEAGLRRLRSELHAARALASRSKARNRRVVADLDAALRVVSTYHRFVTEVRGFAVSRQRSERASVLDMGAIGILGVENVLTAERGGLFRILMSGLSETLTYVASRQYVYGSQELLGALERSYGAEVYDELWSVALDTRDKVDARTVREIQASIDGFFDRLAGPDIPPDARVTALHQLLALLVALRCVAALEALR